MNTTGRAHADACRLFIFGQSLDAEITFYRHILLVFELHGAERARFDAFPAPDAQAGIDQYNALIIP
jgi:hypothetical protein